MGSKNEDSARMTPLVVGLTGGIGSGKTAAARMLEALAVPVIDADVVARELVQPGMAALVEIERRFGPEILDAAGALDRSRLRRIVFDDETARVALERILHPRIRAEMSTRLAALRAPYAVLAIPLLLESQQAYAMVNRVLVVDVPVEVQIERTMARDGASRVAVLRIIATQVERERRLSLADDVIDNSGTLEELEQQVAQIHQRYLELARK